MSGAVGGHRTVAHAIVLAALVVIAGAVATTGAAIPAETGEPHPDGSPADQLGGVANETPVRHEDPDEVERAGDLPEVEAWLADRLSDRLRRSAENLSREQYDRARSLLGEQYRFHLERHRDIADNTASEADDAASESYETAGTTQRAFIEAIRDYRRTYASFEEARELGDYDNARRLGSQLERNAEQVDRTGRRLNATYGDLETNSDREFDRSQTVVTTLVANVTETQRTVRERFFTATRLTVVAERRQISFDRPLVVSGRLTTENGTPVPDRPIALAAGEVRRQVRTDEDGRFTLVYRPVRLPLSTRNVTLAFDPAEDSRFLEASTTVPVQVSQSTPKINVTGWPESSAFRDPVEVNGSVTVAETPVSGLPLVLAVGDHRIRETMTGPGGFRAQGQLPLGVSPGTHPITVRIPLEDRAIAGTRVDHPFQVRTAPTTLRLDVSDAGRGEVDVDGRLVARDSIAVASVSIRFTLDGVVLGTVRTTQTGAFATTFSVPQSSLDEGATPVTVRATFDPAGTNLEPTSARATTVVTPPTGGTDVATSQGLRSRVEVLVADLTPIERAGTVLALLLVIGGAVVFRRGLRRLVTEGEIEFDFGALRSRVGRIMGGGTPEVTGTAEHASPSNEAEATVVSPESSASAVLIDRAERALTDDDPDDAVRTAYAAVRGTIGADLDVSPSRTHWEFLADCGSDGFEEETLAALHALTVDYERAAFAAESADRETAAEAIERAKQLTARVGGVEPA